MKSSQDELLRVSLFNALLLCRKKDCRDVDLLCGFAKGTVASMRSKGFSIPGINSKIERAMDFRLFSDERTWHLRQACFYRYGFDPMVVEKHELKKRIEQLEIRHRVPPKANRDDLVQTILDFCAVRSGPQTITT